MNYFEKAKEKVNNANFIEKYEQGTEIFYRSSYGDFAFGRLEAMYKSVNIPLTEDELNELCQLAEDKIQQLLKNQKEKDLKEFLGE